MTHWQFFNPVRIISGNGVSQQLSWHLSPGHYLLLTTPGMVSRGTARKLIHHTGAEYSWTTTHVAPNPELDILERICARLRDKLYDGIVALGGGSVIDAAKVLSALLPSSDPQTLSKHLRQGSALDFSQCVPVVCIPTTSGTGADVTPFATVWDGSAKHSLTDNALYPRLSLLDPSLTLTLPFRETLYTALDALSHALETLWNVHASPLSCDLALSALAKISENLDIVLSTPSDIEARSALQLGSLYAGLAISQNRTAMAHSISYPLTAQYGVPHGLACSFTLLTLLELVDENAAWTVALPIALRTRLVDLLRKLNLGSLIQSFCSSEQIIALIPQMFNPHRANNFKLHLTSDQLEQVLETSLRN